MRRAYPFALVFMLLAVSALDAAVTSSVNAQFYGFVKFNAAMEQTQTATGDYALYVSGTEQDWRLCMTTLHSRLGFKLTGPSSDNVTSRAQIEVDFNGAATGSRKNSLLMRMRHAYLEIAWPKADFAILAGQTWDVISPLTAPTLNITVLWSLGNIGFRRAQLRLTKGFDVKSSRFQLELAALKTFLDSGATESTRSELPTLQGRLSAAFKALTDKKTTLGIGFLFGKEQTSTTATAAAVDAKAWAVAADFNLPLHDSIGLQAEFFYGKNIDAYMGGALQGLNAAGEEIPSMGGWFALYLGPVRDFTFHAGLGLDDPKDSDLDAGARTRNMIAFANAWYQITQQAKVGIEPSYIRTDIKGSDNQHAVRFETLLMYVF